MTTILLSIVVLGVLGAIFGAVLAFASRIFHVEVDPRESAVREALDGANCGGCGYPGCDGYATALADGSETRTNKCTAGGNGVAQKLASVCGTAFEETVKTVAFVHCRGNCDVTQKKDVYQGTQTCKAVKLLYGGDGSCQYGCLGYGDCAAVCPEHAIRLINGVAKVNPAACISCGQCVKTCPQKIISLIPETAAVKIACSSKDKGVPAKKKCTSACIGCGLCQRKCPNGAVTVENNLAVFNYELCTGCGACQAACPQKCIL